VFAKAVTRFDQEVKPNFTSGNNTSHRIKFTGANLTDDDEGNLKNDIMTLDRYV
jgi:hypothetical protein